MLRISNESCRLLFMIVIASYIATGNCLIGAKLLSISKSRLLLGNSIPSAKIALTREDGANDKLAKLLEGLEVYEIPCIMFDAGEDASKLPNAITSHDLIVITSPQAAKTFLESWKIAGKPDNLKIATVGDGSSKSLIAEGLIPVFEPSDSTARTLAAELPLSLGSTVLYPSSAIAENTLSEGLEKRGFVVTRLNTYTTIPAVWSEEQLLQARAIDIVTFASPSAVRTWSEKVGTDFTAVVIGPTSAKEATTQGFKWVVSPEGSKGIGAWAEKIKTTAADFQSSNRPQKQET